MLKNTADMVYDKIPTLDLCNNNLVSHPIQYDHLNERVMFFILGYGYKINWIEMVLFGTLLKGHL